jgi:hypothetical protein
MWSRYGHRPLGAGSDRGTTAAQRGGRARFPPRSRSAAPPDAGPAAAAKPSCRPDAVRRGYEAVAVGHVGGNGDRGLAELGGQRFDSVQSTLARGPSLLDRGGASLSANCQDSSSSTCPVSTPTIFPRLRSTVAGPSPNCSHVNTREHRMAITSTSYSAGRVRSRPARN